MHKYFLFSCLMFCLQNVFGQEDIIQDIRRTLDTLVSNLETETVEDKRMAIVLQAYNTGMEGYPQLIIELGQKLYALSQQNKDLLTESSAWSFYGQGYRLSGNYTKGLECHHKAVVLAEKTGNKSLLAIAQNQMAHIYKDREENEKALRLYQAAYANALTGKISETQLWPPMNMGAVFLVMNQPDSSLYYSQLAHDGCIKENILRNMPYILAHIGGAYSKLGNIPQSNAYFNKAIAAAEESQSARYRNLVYINIAEHYRRQNQQDSCVYFAKKAIDVVQNTVFTFLSIKPSKMLMEIYETSNADSTLKYLKLYRVANDSLFNARANQQLQIMTFEEDQRQQELTRQKEKYQYNIKMNVMLGGLGTILLIALILYRNNKQKQKANLLLHRQKEEIESTLLQLKTTQAQLVQSEKMASLGELTAGIAHEIQNPLNFVNNFSEVSHELVDEMNEELSLGNIAAANAIAQDLKQNLEKITHHGKRADAIVKGMLQHSRTSAGAKEPTDINALADEYLRLAYHGMRAKDKSFNATIKTDFDTSIGLINVVPQDIGRVLLNLITNAFYAVSAKPSVTADVVNSLQPSPPWPPGGGKEFIPTVTVTTRKYIRHSASQGGERNADQGGEREVDRKVEISVRDNGPGIPDSVRDKIFQPFFTTKPTGQGTGLGLSISYDIIKAYGGDIRVESKENLGTTFTISLPTLN